MRTVADQFVETLAAVGVKRIYGIVGDSLNGITDAIRRQGKIEWIHVRHEEVGAFAAGARATRQMIAAAQSESFFIMISPKRWQSGALLYRNATIRWGPRATISKGPNGEPITGALEQRGLCRFALTAVGLLATHIPE